MKKIIFVLLSAALMSNTAESQKISVDKVPASVMKSFKEKFPGAEKVSWEMDKKDYEAAFTWKSVEESATFDAGGKWVETEIEIKVAELPGAVQKAVSQQFAGFKITEASKLETAKYGKCFEVEVKKGDAKYAATFSPEGKMLEKENLKDEKKNDEKEEKN